VTTIDLESRTGSAIILYHLTGARGFSVTGKIVR